MRKPLNLAYCRRQAAGANCSPVQFAIKVTILAFLAIFCHFHATYLHKNIQITKQLVHLFYHGNADEHAILQEL